MLFYQQFNSTSGPLLIKDSMFYLVFYSTQLTHDLLAKNESIEVAYIPVVMIIAPIIMFAIMRTCLQESHL